jgi:hypothetical protein
VTQGDLDDLIDYLAGRLAYAKDNNFDQFVIDDLNRFLDGLESVEQFFKFVRSQQRERKIP